jgi:hypothetical protein
MRRLGRGVAVAVAAVLGGCGDSGPQGPGSFTAGLDVVGPAVGAVIVDVTGEGIRGFEGTGDTRIFHDVTDVTVGAHRVIAMSGSGSISFRVQVDRVEQGFPIAVVVDAVGTDNLPRGAAGATVRFSN